MLLPLAIAQGLGLVLVIGKALNVKDLQDVGSPGETEKMVLELKEDKKSREEIRGLLLEKLRKKQRKLRPITAAEDEDEVEEDLCMCCFRSGTSRPGHYRESSPSSLERNHVEMTTQRHSRALRDSIGPEMAPSRISFDGVERLHRMSSRVSRSSFTRTLQADAYLGLRQQQNELRLSLDPTSMPSSNHIRALYEQRLSLDQTQFRRSSAAAAEGARASQRLHIHHTQHRDTTRLSFEGRESPSFQVHRPGHHDEPLVHGHLSTAHQHQHPHQHSQHQHRHSQHHHQHKHEHEHSQQQSEQRLSLDQTHSRHSSAATAGEARASQRLHIRHTQHRDTTRLSFEGRESPSLQVHRPGHHDEPLVHGHLSTAHQHQHQHPHQHSQQQPRPGDHGSRLLSIARMPPGALSGLAHAPILSTLPSLPHTLHAAHPSSSEAFANHSRRITIDAPRPMHDQNRDRDHGQEPY